MKKQITKALCLALALVMALALAVPAAAYDRQEATVASGGTEVTVYKGTQNSNDQGNYLADPGDYEAFSRFWTPGRLVSSSNITSSTNFVKETTPDGYTVRGGVEGVSWNAASGTLTLNNASGTVITVEGPSIDVAALNTYNSNLSGVIDYDMPNLTYFKQFDMFQMPGSEGGAPHTKDNSTVQDTVTINLVGENSFNNIRLTGNVKVVFTGSGSLTLNAVGEWDYDDYSEPGFDVLSDPAPYAVSSYPTIGHKGSLSGEDKVESTMPNGMVRTITEDYVYALPEIVLSGVEITEGGSVYNAAQVKGEDYFTFSSETAPTDESRRAEMVTQDLTNSYELIYNGTSYNLVYSDAKTAYYVTVTAGRGPNATTNYYNVTDGITAWEPWESYIGAAGTPAQKVVLTGTGSAAAETVTAVVSPQDLYVNGSYTICEKYNINDKNYFKLRDVASMLSGTAYQFDVDYDADSRTLNVTTGKAYTPAGGEMAVGEDRSDSCVASDWTLTVDGTPVNATIYNLGGNNYFGLRDLGDAIGFGVEYDAPDNFAAITAEEGVAYIHVHDNTTPITDSFFDRFFKEGSAAEGVAALLNSGNYSINNVKVPATEDETTAYNVNQVPALFKGDAGWGIQIHKTTTDTNMGFEEARLQLVNTVSIVRGHTTTLYTDESGYVTRINTTNVESVLVCDRKNWNEDTVFNRGDFALETNRGVRPDINDLHFSTKNVDPAIQAGDFAEYWYDGSDNGWHIRRALAVEGTVAKENGKFIINGTDDRIESNVSRYCLRTYNRPTQFYDSYAALGLNGQKIIVWCTVTGHPIGFTLGEKAAAKATLGLAIENAKAAKDGVTVSADGSGAAGKWVTQEDMDAFNAAIAAAESVYNTNATPSFGYDQAMYALAQALGRGGNNPSGFLGAQGDGSGSGSGTTAEQPAENTAKGLQQSGMDGDSYVWVNDGTTAITDAAFDRYFTGTAAEGVEALLNAGAFYINGIKVPATDSETTSYNVNGVQALYKGDAGWGYVVHKTTTDTNMSFEAARIGFVETLTTVRGHTTTLHLTNGVCDRIDATNIESVYITDIINHGAQAEIKRGDFALETNRGVRPDVDTLSFTNSNGNWDDSIEVGDFAVYWYGENGWTIRRAVPVTATVTKNDAGEFVLNGDDNRIESNVSRYCLRTYNRPTQFYNDAYTRLGLNDLEVTVWCTSTGHPIGFSMTRAQGKAALLRAVENCRAAMADVAVSKDGKDVAAGKNWVMQEDMDAFVAAVDAAETIANRNATLLTEYDQALYELGQAYGQGGNRPSGFVGAQGEGTGA